MTEYIERTRALDIARGTPAHYFLKIEPTADVVEVRHGEWEPIVDLKTSKYRYQHTCGACGKSIFDDNKFNYPHCPNCGTKMDGKGE